MTEPVRLRVIVSTLGCATAVAWGVSLAGSSSPLRAEDDHPTFAQAPLRGTSEADIRSSLEEAERLSRSWRAGDRRKAIQVWERLLELPPIRPAGFEARACLRLGDLYRGLGAMETSLLFYRRTLASSADSLGIRIQAQLGMSRALLTINDLEGGLRYAERALELSRAVSDEHGELTALNTLGIALSDAGELHEAADTLRRATEIAEKGTDARAGAEAKLLLAFTRADSGDNARAIQEILTALESSQELHDVEVEVLARIGLGHAYSKIGDKQRALEVYQEVAPLLEVIQDPSKSASFYTGMGYLYDELGDFGTAEEFYSKALQLNEKLGSIYGASACMIHLGRIRADSRPEEALCSFSQALSRLRDLGDVKLQAVVLADIANVEASLGEEEPARENYSRALALSQTVHDERVEAEIQNNIGDLDLRSGNLTLAQRRFRRAGELSRKTGSPFVEARALFNQARVERAAGRLQEALLLVEEALERVESLRLNVGSHRLRASFVASIYEIHVFHVDLLMELHARNPDEGFDERAFLASERAKARSLMDVLTHDDAAPSAAAGGLAEYEEQLEQELRRRANGAHSESLRELLAAIDRVRALMSPGTGGADSVARTQLVTVQELQDELLDERTAVLAYFFADRASYLWTITSSSFISHRLASRGHLEPELTSLHGLLAQRTTMAHESAKQRQLRLDKGDAAYWEAASVLSAQLLRPALQNLDGVTRLLVAGDGMLHQIPISAFPVATADRSSSQTLEPLASRFEIVRLPSVSSLKLLEARSATRPIPPKKLAVLADPVYDETDPRLSMTGEPGRTPILPEPRLPPVAPGERIRAVLRDQSSDGGGMARLLSTRLEARNVLSLVPPSDRFAALGFEATRSLVTSGELSDYQVVHFAAHGIVDTDLPDLSGIVLSLFDADGRKRDGFLRLHDLYSLDLPVRLVVLSACSTALGKPVRGEGLIGLVSGFLSAGAQGVMASYWEVDDEATSELMTRFYEHLFVDGLSPSKALQLAQVSMWNERRWRSPRYWAAFELQGGWR